MKIFLRVTILSSNLFLLIRMQANVQGSSQVWVFCTSLILASSLRNAKRIEKCSKIVCPPVAATICVKVKERNAQRRYVMMSKCDLKLIKCYGDVITTVVTKKYCNVLRQGETTGVKEEEPVNDSEVAETPQAADQDPKMLQVDPTSQENEKDQDNIVEGNNSDELQEGEPDNNDPAETPKEENPVVQDDVVEEPDLIEIQPDGEKDDDDEQKTLQKDEEGDQTGTACPEDCPTRGVMVCARCSHGVYRTFISSCYMRMYQCKHPKEKLELVSRRACTASAPYLGGMPRPRGLLVEPQDVDPVLKHIFDLRDTPAYS